MTGMLDLRDILEMINNRLDDRTTAQQDAVTQGHELILHVTAQLDDQLEIRWGIPRKRRYQFRFSLLPTNTIFRSDPGILLYL